MRTNQGWWCDTRGNEEYPGCEQNAAVAWFCTVEGREVALCGTCNRAWRNRAQADPGMAHRCPLCVHVYLAFNPPGAIPSAATVAHQPGTMLTGPLADALDLAMFSEGMLIDVRQRVLRRLGADSRMRDTVMHA